MKTSRLLVIIFLVAASSAYAAIDAFLIIEGTKGEALKPRATCAGGVCALNGLPPGVPFRAKVECDGQTYTIPIDADVDGDGVADRAIVSPRDPATGQASGKRMHKPVIFYCVCTSDGQVFRFKTQSEASTKTQQLTTAQQSSLRESPTKQSSSKQKKWLCSNFKFELSEVAAGSGTTISLNFQKIEMTSK